MTYFEQYLMCEFDMTQERYLDAIEYTDEMQLITRIDCDKDYAETDFTFDFDVE